MNALTPPPGGGRPAALADSPAMGLFWGLQYCRAGMLSLTRLELAMESGDRRRIIEAIDRLHALDGEIERKVAALPEPADPDPARGAMEEYLAREKMAVAFEKLVLASGISGPGIASPIARPAPARIDRMELNDDPPFGAPSPPGMIATYGPKAALLIAIVAATGATLIAAL
ncbi:hypothetical protein FHR22_000854 [Sphingopyxis panaciterrae]|uniref:hypothetical protein n=1 Tax=Sphingopyxis panaciterrae TaxID=363841 RepID=UPI00141EF68B|nr:hypothetical protein [Sphingopyxis panaciterrae]NIJ36205.1 hypothetical protein [Sphingopyxis panaciterrae]